MGTFGDSVYSDESQASQLLKNAVLAGSIAGSLPRSPLPQGSYHAREDQTVPSARHSQLSYHLHGLATTQSQSQSKDVSLFREESQKENTPTPASRTVDGSKPPETRPKTGGAVEASKTNEDGAFVEEAIASTVDVPAPRGLPCDTAASVASAPAACSSRRDNASNARNTRPLDRQGPPRMNNMRNRHRSPSTPSEDSFAGPLPPDLEQKKYMKESRVFQQPLSQLDETEEESHSDDEEPSKDAEQSSLPKSSRTRFRELSVTRTSSQSRPAASQDAHSQLFASSDSYPQAQHQEDDDFFPPPHQPRPSCGEFNQNAFQDTQGEQSEPESLAGSLATQLTRPSTPEPTQPDDDDDDDDFPPYDGYPQQSGVTSTTGGPPSILDMVNPDKKWRFQENKAALAQARANYRYMQLAADPEESGAGPSNWEETQPSEASNRPATGQETSRDDDLADEDACEETQPSEASRRPATGRIRDEDEAKYDDEDLEATQPAPASNLPATGHTADPFSSMQALAPTSSRHLNGSDMDIIPDSEPTQPTPVQKTSSSPVLPHLPNVPVGTTSEDVAMEVDPKRASEEDDDEEEIPLAVIATTKPKSKSSPRNPAQQETVDVMIPPPHKRTCTDPLPASSAKSLCSTEEVPSSDPQERLLEVPAQTQKPSRQVRGKPKKAATLPPVTPARSRGRDLDESDDETAISGNPVEPACDNEDVRTELADDESEQLAGRGSSSRKRKRVPSSSVKGSSRSLRTNTYTPPVKSAKRLKPGSVARTATVSATRVFALWKQDSHYYVGTVYSECPTSAQKYTVHFDDGEQDTVDLSKLRRFELRKGEHILVRRRPKAQKGEVVKCLSDRKVAIRLDDDDDEEEEQEFSTEELLIPSRSIVSKWNDRKLTADEIVTMVNPRIKSSPTPSKHGDINSWSKSTRKLFNKVGFVTTMSPGQGDWLKEKKSLEADIKINGGVFFDDWCEVFKMEGTLTGKRWVLTRDDITLLKGKVIDRVFLLADDACHKPKFLIALALGVPCVKHDWLSESIAEMAERDWQPYLLPAGTSEVLNARITQMVDADWGSCDEHIREIVDNRVPSKLFSGLNILCVSPTFVQAKANKRGNSDNEKALEATRMIPRIILCMGAERVESVATTSSASQQLEDYDYIVYREPEEAKKAAHLDTCVPFGWVKECLITGRLLPRD